MAQTITSANTSINSTKLPKVYGMLGKLMNRYHITGGGAMLDYGCGKYTEHLKAKAKDSGLSFWRGYDKYNQPEEVNKEAEYWMKPGLYDVAVCSNVLNVIDDDAEVMNVIRSVIASADVAIFSIYEGDGSGIGRQTKKDCYQRNMKVDDYKRFFRGIRGIDLYGGCIVVNKKLW